jgi:two-component system, cell cycle response regulator
MSQDPRTQVIKDGRRLRRRGDQVRTPTFTVVEGPSIGVLYVLDASRRAHRIGRSEDADLRINTASVSRCHAIAVVASRDNDSGVRIDDNNSTNGIKVNGRRVESQWLDNGDKVRLGDSLLRFQWMSDEEIQFASGLSTKIAAAARDPLTGLLSRAFVTDRLPSVLQAAEQRARPLSCIMLDLDRFKNINDTHGHLVGDIVIRRAARAVSATLRGSDYPVRYGGEEFLLVLTDTSIDQALEAAHRTRAAIAAIDLEDVVPGLVITASQGVALRVVGETVDTWIARADMALYTAKDQGRDRVELAVPAEFDPPPPERAAESTLGAPSLYDQDLDSPDTLDPTDQGPDRQN